MANKNKVLNTFHEGLNTDTNVNKYNNAAYYSANNLRLTTNNSLESHALTNIPGPFSRISDSTISSNGRVVGSTNVRDILVVFFQDIANSRSEIYKVEYPTFTFTLVYSDKDSTSKLNFDYNNPIHAVGRYESPTIKKVYWCDGVEENRFINIDEDHTISPGVYKEASLLAFNPNTELNSPIIEDVLSGGNLFSGMISYAYQLYKRNSNESSVSSVSPLVPLSSRNGQPLNNFRGDEVDVNTGNSVKIQINDLDSNFDRVRIYSIFYNDKNADPIINIISESDYTTTSYTFIDNGAISLQTLTVEEFRSIVGKTLTSLTLAVKKNYLFLGNIKEDKKEIDFDARAYRFISGVSNTYLYDSDGNSYRINNSYQIYEVNSVPVTPYDIPEDHDCINYFNDFDNDLEQVSGSNTASSYPYEYKIGSSTKGGDGPNVSYQFSYEDTAGNSSTGNSLRNIPSTSTSYLNPIVVSKYTGYKRGEVYRFGVEFLFKNGERSFVKWIGDIRFPPVNDSSYRLTITSSPNINTRQLCVRFDIDLSTLSTDTLNELAGFRIVRVERKESDKNILYQGIGGALFEYIDYLATTDDPYASYSRIPTTYDYNQGQILGTESDNAYLVSPQRVVALDTSILEVNSPEISFSKNLSYNSGDKLYAVGVQPLSSSKESYNWQGVAPYPAIYHRERNYDFSSSNPLKRIASIDDVKLSELRESGTNSYDNFGGQLIVHRTCAHIFPSGNQYENVDSYRGTCAFIHLSSAFDMIGVVIPASPREVFMLEHIRNRFGSQYGGNTYNARTQNTYISTVMKDIAFSDDAKTFITIDEYNAGLNIFDVFGGDTFVSYFDQMRSCYDVEVDPSSINSAQEYITFPVETTINCDYRRDEIIKYYTNASDYSAAGGNIYTIQETQTIGINKYPDLYPEDLTDLYLYNDAYSRDNNSQVASPKPFDFETQEEFDVMVMVSDKKINGEYTDSWTKFSNNLSIEVESEMGPLTALINYKDSLIFFQNNGFGKIAVEERAQISDNEGSLLSLGTGPVLERYDYASTNFGALRQEAVIATPNNLYYIDEYDKSIRVLADSDLNGNLSKIKGVSNKISKMLPSNNLTLGYDPEYKEVIFTTDLTALIYNELTQCFVSNYDFTNAQDSIVPQLHKVAAFSELAGELYGVTYDTIDDSLKLDQFNINTGDPLGSTSEVTIIIHPNGNDIFTFDVLDLRTRSFDDFSQSLPSNLDINTDTVYEMEYQNSYIAPILKTIIVGDNIKKIARVLRTNVPLTSNKKRFVDSYLMVTLRFDHTSNHKYLLHDITTYIRPTKV